MTSARSVFLAALGAAVSLAMLAQPVGARSANIECGIFEWVPPDATTPGSVTFGASSSLGLPGDVTYVIAPDATLPASFGQAIGAPICVELTLDQAGAITALTYAATGTLRGRVVLVGDPVNDPSGAFYVTAGRVVTPVFVVLTYPGIRTVLANAVDTGREVRITFTMNTDYGVPVAFDVTTAFRGPVALAGSDIAVDGAILPAEILDESDRARLTQIAVDGDSAKVTIRSAGTINVSSGALDVVTGLEITRAAPDPVTSSIQGPCSGSRYYGVLDNSTGKRAFTFRYQWVTQNGTHVVLKVVPKGQVYRTWSYRAKPGTYVRISFWDRAQHRWLRIASRFVSGSESVPCDLVPRYEAAI